MAEHGPRRARGARAGQRPLPLELPVHEGLRRASSSRARASRRSCVVEPQEEDARRHGVDGGRPHSSRGYDEHDPRPPDGPLARARPGGRRASKGTSASASSSRQGTQTADLMVGEPTTPTQAFFDAFPSARRRHASARRRHARSRPSRRSSACASRTSSPRSPWSTSRERLRPGMTEAEAAALWEGHVHAVGVGYQGKVGMARGYSLVWSGPGIRTFTATGHRPDAGARADAVRDLGLRGRLLVRPHEEPLPAARCTRGVRASCWSSLLAVFDGGSSQFADRRRTAPRARPRSSALGSPRPATRASPSHPICHGVGARAHEPPYAHQAGTGYDRRPAWCWRSSRGSTGRAEEASALEDNFLVGVDRQREALLVPGRLPRDRGRAMSRSPRRRSSSAAASTRSPAPRCSRRPASACSCSSATTTLGGAIRTAEITEPGFVHEVFAAWHPLFVGSGAYAELKDDLHARGLEYLNTDLPTALGLPGRLEHLPDDLARGERGGAGTGTLPATARPGDASSSAFMPNADLAFGVLGTELWSRGRPQARAAGLPAVRPPGHARVRREPAVDVPRLGDRVRSRPTACTGCSRRGCCTPASGPTRPPPGSWPR